MNSPDNKEQQLRRREQELKDREREIRLRELEAEINQPPLHQTVKHQEKESPLKRRYGTLVKVGKFVAIIVAVVVSIKIATWLASVILVGAVAWVAYKIFFESARSKK